MVSGHTLAKANRGPRFSSKRDHRTPFQADRCQPGHVVEVAPGVPIAASTAASALDGQKAYRPERRSESSAPSQPIRFHASSESGSVAIIARFSGSSVRLSYECSR